MCQVGKGGQHTAPQESEAVGHGSYCWGCNTDLQLQLAGWKDRLVAPPSGTPQKACSCKQGPPQPGFRLPVTMQRANLGSTDENTELTSCKLSSPYPPLDAARALSLQPRPKGRSHQMSPKMLTIGPHTPPHPASHVISGGTSFNSEHLRRCAT